MGTRSSWGGKKSPPSTAPAKAVSLDGMTEAKSRADLFLDYLAGEDLTEYDLTHRVRLTETLKRMDAIIQPGQKIVELGGISRLATFLARSDAAEVSEYTSDLRFPLDLPSDTYDMVLMLEVLEHLNDRHRPESEISEIAMFTGSGANSCMREVHRILKPGGHLVLTTPNASSVDTLGKVLLKLHPFQYGPHVREYTPDEVIELARSCGLGLISHSTIFAWNALPGIDREQLLGAIISLGFDASDRGDDAVFMFCKND